MRPECEIVEMSPAIAKEILAANSRNRGLRRPYVRQLAGAMQRGEWTANGEPIQIAVDGTLLNGQHRLNAVIEADHAVSMLVVRNLPVQARRTLDSGARRNLSDILTLHGELSTTNLGATLGLLYRYRTGQKLNQANNNAPTAQQALDLLEREPTIRDALYVGARANRAFGIRVSVASLMFHLFEEADPGEGKAFFDALCDVDGEPTGSAVRALCTTIRRARSERRHSIPTYVMCALTIKAFNAWREGRDVELLLFRPGGTTREPFPEIAPPVGDVAVPVLADGD